MREISTRNLIAWLTSMLLGSAMAPALALEETVNLEVTATVVGTCSLAGTSTSLDFGTLTAPKSPGQYASGSVSIACSNGINWSLHAPTGPYDNGSTRRLSNGTTYLDYALVLENPDPSTNPPLPMTANLYTGTSTGANVVRNLYAVLPAPVTKLTPIGTYSSGVLTLTLTYTP